MKLSLQYILKRKLVILTALLAFGFIALNVEWAISRLVWSALRLPTPPASAWYMVEFTNHTSQDLLVRVSLVNDRRFVVFNFYDNYTKEWLGRVEEKEQIIRVGETHLFDIPSPVDPNLGIVLITGITEITKSKFVSPTQYVGMRLCSRNMANQQNRIIVTFDDSDLVNLNIDSFDNWSGWKFGLISR